MTTDKDSFQLNHLVVVDNDSQDDSTDNLDNLDLPLTFIQNKKNIGFAAACNQGAKGSKADFLLFLNPDTCLFNNSLVQSLNYMEGPNNQDIGILGIQLVDEVGRISRSCARFPTVGSFFVKMFGLDILFPKIFSNHFMIEWDHNESRVVDQVIGAFFLIRRQLFVTMGGFDERFFVYFEEVDLSRRAYNAGWKTIYLADVQAYHKGGGTSDKVKASRLFYSLRSRILYGYKHFNWLAATALMLGTLLIEPFTRLAFALINRSREQAEETIKGCVMLWSNLPTLLRKNFREK